MTFTCHLHDIYMTFNKKIYIFWGPKHFFGGSKNFFGGSKHFFQGVQNQFFGGPKTVFWGSNNFSGGSKNLFWGGPNFSGGSKNLFWGGPTTFTGGPKTFSNFKLFEISKISEIKKNFLLVGQDYWGQDCHDGHIYRIWALLGLVFGSPYFV